MLSILKKLAVPLTAAAIAGGALLFAGYVTSFSPIEAIAFGTAIFGAALSSLHYILSLLANRPGSSDNIIDLERSVLKKIAEIENSHSVNDAKQLAERINGLETRLTALLQTFAENVPEKAKSVVTEDHGAETRFDDEKIVRLKTKRPLAERLPAETGQSARITKSTVTGLLEKGTLSVKLQPIVNLVTQDIEAVEALGFLETQDGLLAVGSLLPRFNDDQRSQLDLAIVAQLSLIARKLENDGQALPIHYSFASARQATKGDWEKLVTLLRGDQKLGRVFVPVLNMADFRYLENKGITRFLDLKELGLKPVLDQCEGMDAIMKITRQKRVSGLKITAKQLLSYTAIEGQRFATVISDELARQKMTLFVSDIDVEHEAVNLIDLDIVTGQGEYLSPARAIKLSESNSVDGNDDALGNVSDA